MKRISPFNRIRALQLFLALGYIGLERLVDGRVHRRRLVRREQLLPDRVGAFGGGFGAVFVPVSKLHQSENSFSVLG